MMLVKSACILIVTYILVSILRLNRSYSHTTETGYAWLSYTFQQSNERRVNKLELHVRTFLPANWDEIYFVTYIVIGAKNED